MQITFSELFARAFFMVLAVISFAGLSELGARKMFPDTQETTLPCLNREDPTTGVTAKPNTVCRQRFLEGANVDYRFNECGHRTDSLCHLAVASASNRIVVIGSSLVEGYGVPVETSFTKLLGPKLSKSLKGPVDTYSEGMQWGTPRSVALRIGEAIAQKPSMVLWPISSYDVQKASLRLPFIPGVQDEDREDREQLRNFTEDPTIPLSRNLPQRISASYYKHGGVSGMSRAAWQRVSAILTGPFKDSRAVYAAQHALFSIEHVYIKHYAENRGESNYLRADAIGGSAMDMTFFSKYYRRVSRSLRVAGIPLFVVVLPTHSQVTLLSGSAGDFSELAPLALEISVKAIAEKEGDNFIDIFDQFRTVAGPGQYFFTMDGHMNERGHELMANVLQRALLTNQYSREILSAGRTASPQKAN